MCLFTVSWTYARMHTHRHHAHTHIALICDLQCSNTTLHSTVLVYQQWYRHSYSIYQIHTGLNRTNKKSLVALGQSDNLMTLEAERQLTVHNYKHRSSSNLKGNSAVWSRNSHSLAWKQRKRANIFIWRILHLFYLLLFLLKNSFSKLFLCTHVSQVTLYEWKVETEKVVGWWHNYLVLLPMSFWHSLWHWDTLLDTKKAEFTINMAILLQLLRIDFSETGLQIEWKYLPTY